MVKIETKVVLIEPFDSLFFGGGIGVPLGGSSRSMPHPTPWTVSGAVLSLLVRKHGLDSVLNSSGGGDVESEEEKGRYIKYAFYGPLIYFSEELWVPAPRDLEVVWAREDEMKLRALKAEAWDKSMSGRVREGDDGQSATPHEMLVGESYRNDLPPIVLSPDSIYLYDHFELPLIRLRDIDDYGDSLGILLLRGAPKIYPEERLGIKMDEERGSVEEGMLYRTVHIRVQEGERDLRYRRMGYAMISIGMADKEVIPDVHGIERLGGEGRPAGIFTDSGRHIQQFRGGEELQPGEVLKVVLVSPAIYMRDKWRTTTLPDISGLPGRPEWIGPRVVTSAPRRLSGWSIPLGRARKMYSAVPPGTVYFLRMSEGADKMEFLLEFWRLSLYWDRGFGSPVVVKLRR